MVFIKYNNSIFWNDYIKEYYLFDIFFYISYLFLILGEGYRLGDGFMTNLKDICYICLNGIYNRGIIDIVKLDNI